LNNGHFFPPRRCVAPVLAKLVSVVPELPGGLLKGHLKLPPELVARRKPGGKLTSYPLAKFPTLYLEFARLKTPEDVIDFFNKFGPLMDAGLKPTVGERISRTLELAQTVRDLLSDNRNRPKLLAALFGVDGKPIGRLLVWLVSDEATGALRLRLAPPNLLEALWLQLAQKILGNATVKTCIHCGKWFEVGPGTGRRLDAKFCSDEHRILHNSKKRTTEK
jgi:hypothetical protein